MTKASVLLLTLLGLFSDTFAAGELLPAGTEARRFLIQDLEGRRIGLRDYVGPTSSKKPKMLLLSFWSVSCIPCRQEMPLLQKWAAEHPGTVELLFVNLDKKSDGEQVMAFLKEYNVQGSVLLDFYQATGKNYQVCSGTACNVPALYIIDQAGIIRKGISGFDQADDLLAELSAQLAAIDVAPKPITAITNTADAETKFRILHDVLKSVPIDEAAARNGVKREQLIEIFKETEAAARRQWNMAQ